MEWMIPTCNFKDVISCSFLLFSSSFCLYLVLIADMINWSNKDKYAIIRTCLPIQSGYSFPLHLEEQAHAFVCEYMNIHIKHVSFNKEAKKIYKECKMPITSQVCEDETRALRHCCEILPSRCASPCQNPFPYLSGEKSAS